MGRESLKAALAKVGILPEDFLPRNRHGRRPAEAAPVAPASPIPGKKGPKPGGERIKHGSLKPFRYMLRRRSDSPPFLTLKTRTDIVRALLMLQKKGRLQVWIDDDLIKLGRFGAPADAPRRPINWSDLVPIADGNEQAADALVRLVEKSV